MSVSKESISLWEGRNNADSNNEKKARLYGDAHALNKALHDGNELGILNDAGQGRIGSGTYSRKGEIDGEAVTLISEACIRPSDATLATYLAVGVKRENEDAADTSYFSITQEGVAVNLDTMDDLLDDDPMMDVLQSSMRISTEGLDRQISNKRLDLARQKLESEKRAEHEAHEKRLKREEIRKGLAITAGIGMAAGALSFGIYSGVQAWIVGPEKANQEHRAEYDAQNHILPGQGVEISKESFSTMPNGAFKDIPTYGGNDKNFDNPRRVTLDSKTTCLDVAVDGSVQGKKLVAAISQDSPYQAKHITASSVNEKVRVCLVESISSSDSSQPSIEVAIQLK